MVRHLIGASIYSVFQLVENAYRSLYIGVASSLDLGILTHAFLLLFVSSPYKM